MERKRNEIVKACPIANLEGWLVFTQWLDVPYLWTPQAWKEIDPKGFGADWWVPLSKSEHVGRGKGYWVRVSPEPLSVNEYRNCRNLAMRTGHQVCMLVGPICPDKLIVQRWCKDGTSTDDTQSLRESFANGGKPSIAYPFGVHPECNHDFVGAFREGYSHALNDDYNRRSELAWINNRDGGVHAE